jgi:hypothetical protein
MMLRKIGFLLLTGLAILNHAVAGTGEGKSLTQQAIRKADPPYLEFYRRASYTNFSFTVGLGLTAYSGELSNPFHFRRQRYHMNPHGSVAAQYRLTNYISARAEGGLFRLYSRAAEGQWDNKAFRGHNAEYYLAIVHDLFPKSEVEFHARRWNPYVFLGIGMLNYNPTNPETRESYRTQNADGEWTYPTMARIIPMGIGINYYPHDHISIGFEAGFRPTNTPYLDDTVAENDPNPRNDRYFIYGFRLTKQILPRKYNYNKRVKAGQRY